MWSYLADLELARLALEALEAEARLALAGAIVVTALLAALLAAVHAVPGLLAATHARLARTVPPAGIDTHVHWVGRG